MNIYIYIYINIKKYINIDPFFLKADHTTQRYLFPQFYISYKFVENPFCAAAAQRQQFRAPQFRTVPRHISAGCHSSAPSRIPHLCNSTIRYSASQSNSSRRVQQQQSKRRRYNSSLINK